MRCPIFLLILTLVIPSAAASLDDWNNTQALRAGQKIEIVKMDLKRMKGTFSAAGGDEIRLIASGTEVAVPKAHVFRISSVEKSKRLRNTLIGAAIGAAAGLAIGAATDSSFSEADEHIAKTIFTPIGAGAGAGLGSAFAGFETIYRAPRRVTP